MKIIKEHKEILFIFLIFAFLWAVAIYLFVSGCTDTHTTNYLKKHGVEVELTVTDIEVDSSFENSVEYYTFSYNSGEKEYSFRSSADRNYKMGDTLTTYIDPQNPSLVVLPSYNLFFAFFLTFIACGFLAIHSKTRRLIPYPILLIEIAGIVAGSLLPHTGLIIGGSILLVITALLLFLLWR